MPSTKCEIVSKITFVSALNMSPTLIRAHEDLLMEDETQSKSLLHVCQEIEHD